MSCSHLLLRVQVAYVYAKVMNYIAYEYISIGIIHQPYVCIMYDRLATCAPVDTKISKNLRL